VLEGGRITLRDLADGFVRAASAKARPSLTSTSYSRM
jgi:hypothetical protein